MEGDSRRAIEPGTKYLRTKAAAALLGLRPGTLAQWRVSGRQDLKWVKLGRAVAYSIAELERFAAANQRRTTSDEGAAR